MTGLSSQCGHCRCHQVHHRKHILRQNRVCGLTATHVDGSYASLHHQYFTCTFAHSVPIAYWPCLRQATCIVLHKPRIPLSKTKNQFCRKLDILRVHFATPLSDPCFPRTVTGTFTTANSELSALAWHWLSMSSPVLPWPLTGPCSNHPRTMQLVLS